MTKMYAYQKKLKDEESWANEGQVFGGVAIGIILFGKAGYALPPGSIENATTFKYPVHFTSISAASVESVVSPNLNPEVLSQLVSAGKYLETQGCRALIGACGYFANYLPEVISQLDTPCFFSSLMQIPMILKSLKPGKKVGILCANGSVLKDAPALANCGVDDTSKVVISGAEVLPEMQKVLDGQYFGVNFFFLDRFLAEDLPLLAIQVVPKDLKLFCELNRSLDACQIRIGRPGTKVNHYV